jgi:hypothetical protein
MTPRALRRAQERQAKKLARKAAAQLPIAASVPQTIQESAAAPQTGKAPVSEAKLAANRRNALFSSGPTSDPGKAKSCLNALKTGLTGQTVLLPTEDAAEYRAHIQDFENEFHPVGRFECDLVQAIADTAWRLKRIPRLEMAIYAQGSVEFAEQFAQHEPEMRRAMIELQTYTAYEKQLRNLQIQEARLHRRYIKDIDALVALQKQRQEKPSNQAEEIEDWPDLSALQRNPATNPAPIGFEFSTGEIARNDAAGKLSARPSRAPNSEMEAA